MALPFELNGSIMSAAGAALVALAWVGHELLFDRRFRHETGSAYGVGNRVHGAGYEHADAWRARLARTAVARLSNIDCRVFALGFSRPKLPSSGHLTPSVGACVPRPTKSPPEAD